MYFHPRKILILSFFTSLFDRMRSSLCTGFVIRSIRFLVRIVAWRHRRTNNYSEYFFLDFVVDWD
jgi:hypothetical protein